LELEKKKQIVEWPDCRRKSPKMQPPPRKVKLEKNSNDKMQFPNNCTPSNLPGKLCEIPEEFAHGAGGQAAAEEPTWVRPVGGHSPVYHQALGCREVVQWVAAQDLIAVSQQEDT